MNFSEKKPNKVVPDKDVTELLPSEATYAKNVRLGEINPDAGFYTRYKIPGNLEVFNIGTGPGRNVWVGGWENDDRTKFVAFFWNEFGDHSILRYTPDVGTETILRGSYLALRQDKYPDLLNYQAEEYFVSADVLEDILGWTDWTETGPRAVLMSKAIAGDFNVDVATNTWMLDQGKRPPALPPLFWLDDPAYGPNVIAEDEDKPAIGTVLDPIQIGVSYTYWDKSQSRIGPASKAWWNNNVRVYLPFSEVQYLLKSFDPIIPNSYVTYINWYFRRGNDGPWLLITRTENITANYVTLGAAPLGRTPNLLIPKLTQIFGSASLVADTTSDFDAIPRTARVFAFAGSRGNWGNFTEDFDPLKGTLTVANTVTVPDTVEYRTLLTEYNYVFGVAGFDKAGKRSQIFLTAGFNKARYSDWFTLDPPPNTDVYQDIAPPDIDTIFGNTFGVTLTLSLTEAIPAWVDNLRFFAKRKSDANFFFRCLSRPVCFVDQVNPTTGVDENLFYSRPAGNRIGFFIDNNTPLNYSADQNLYVRICRIMTFGNFSSPTRQTAFDSLRKEYKVVDYRAGCLICEISDQDIAALGIVYRFTSPIGYGLVDSFFWLYNIGGASDQSVPSFKYGLIEVEVISRRAEMPELFNEIGQAVLVSDISDPTNIQMFWAGDCYLTKAKDQYQTLQFADAGTPDSGGTPARLTISSVKYTYYVNSMNLNGATLESWNSDYGQGNLYSSTQQRKNKRNFTRHGAKYFSGTAINGLFTVEADSEAQVALDLGQIVQMFSGAIDDQTGNKIRVLCEQGGEMIFLDRNQLQNQDGTDNLITSSLVYGTQNAMSNNIGCQYMRHAARTSGGVVYFISANKQGLCQWSDNGIIELSHRDVQNERGGFRSVLLKITSWRHMKIGIDEFYSEVVVSNPQYEGFAYNYKFNTFQGYRSYIKEGETGIDGFQTLLNQLYSFFQGRLFLHNKSDSNGDNTLFDNAYSAEIEVVDNGSRDLLKLYKKLNVCTYDEAWYAHIQTDQNSGYTNVLQESQVGIAEYQNRNGLYCATIKKDMNSPGGIVDGYPMRGRIARVKFTTDSPKVVGITHFEIGSDIAIPNKR